MRIVHKLKHRGMSLLEDITECGKTLIAGEVTKDNRHVTCKTCLKIVAAQQARTNTALGGK